MTIDIAGYLAEVQKVHATGQATEHAYRPALERLFKSIAPDVTAINEPKGIKVGRPDFVFLRSAGKGADITVGHCEAKDVGLDINPRAMNDFNKAQFDRYVNGLPNLIYTNGLDFRFYKKGELAREISIADYLMGIQPKPDQFSVLTNQLKDFAVDRPQSITTAEDLAERMANSAIIIKDILFNSLKEDADLQTDLTDQYKSFKEMLIHDLSAEDFADIYAETIAYGMFGARLHDKTLENFSRAEALELMPKSNPFLRNLFTYVAGPQLDERISRTVDELAEIFQATDLQKLFEDFGKFTQRNDPFIHFYETFLAEYNPAKRKARGVWYTPEPVVNFIVRAVDDVLKTEFGLPLGLADTSKVTVDWDTGQTDKKGKAVTIKKDVHRVQILDPAAGTGTFLAEVIKQIAPKVKDMAEGQWSSYVEKELIPRLHGFELLMASYAMCHMKLDMMLTEMGYKPTGNPPRLGVYLTNSLEEGERANQTLPFAQWLSNEAKEANTIKRDMPIMCVIGNPPYSVSSSNTSPWILSKLKDYKKDLGEKKTNLDDDYIKFIRLAQSYVEKNGTGIVGFITNHSYLDGITHRVMRQNLASAFDEIRILDLHGSSKKKEKAANGGKDENVFDITVGVAVVLLIKRQQGRPEKCVVSSGDLFGTRQVKYEILWELTSTDNSIRQLNLQAPYYFFKTQNDSGKEVYAGYFSLTDLFKLSGSGKKNERDKICIRFSHGEMQDTVEDFLNLTEDRIRIKYSLGKDSRDWTIVGAIADLRQAKGAISPELYRPFDTRFTWYSGKSRGFSGTPGGERMKQMVRPNLALLTCRQQSTFPFQHSLVSDKLVDICCLSSQTKETGYVFPLYLYPDEQSLDQMRRVNFDPKIRRAIVMAAIDKAHDVPDEVAIFDYIYGVLHCPAYRETYKEFLKIDFPRVPYPPSPAVFWDVSTKGTELRKLHLMEDAAIGAAPYKFTGAGDSVVTKISFEGGVVRINATQGFEGVPEIAWNFYIGGYQPAQKWLKDRKTRALSFEDVRHYQKIIKILSETDRIMKTIKMPL